MIDIIEGPLPPAQIDQILNRRNKIFVGQNTFTGIDVDPEFLVDLVPPDASEIISFGIKKEPLQQGAGVCHRRRIARTKTAVNILERFLLVMRRIFPERLHDCVIVRNVDDFHFANLQSHDLADRRQSERLERTRHGHFAVADFLGKYFGGQFLFVELVAQLKILDVVKKFDDVFVRTVAKRAQESRSEKLAAALAPIEINVKEIGGIKLHLDPRAPIRNDAEAVEHLAVQVDGRFKSYPGGAVQLTNHHTLCAIDHKRALRRHERDFPFSSRSWNVTCNGAL